LLLLTSIIKTKKQSCFKDQEKFDTFKSLREYSYNLVDYDRTIKNNINGAFEMIVERSIRSALMSVIKVWFNASP
jgi:hypothetical protein